MNRPQPWPADPVLIGFCGLSGSGKSTAAAYLAEAYAFEVVSFAQALKEMLESLFAERGVDYAHLYDAALKEQTIPRIGVSARVLMQALGDWGRGIDPEFWLHALQQRIGLWGPDAAPVHDRIVIDDVRFPNEAAWLIQRGGTLVHLLRARAFPTLQPAQPFHDSERHAGDLGAQLTFVNNGLTPHSLHELLDGAMAGLGVEPRERSGL